MKNLYTVAALVVVLFVAFLSSEKAEANFTTEQGTTVGLILGYHLTCESLSDSGVTTISAFSVSNGVAWDSITSQVGVLEGWEKVRVEGCYNSKEVLKALNLYKLF